MSGPGHHPDDIIRELHQLSHIVARHEDGAEVQNERLVFGAGKPLG